MTILQLVQVHCLHLTQGANNVAIGQLTADALTTGGENVAIGFMSLGAAIAGARNVAIGCGAMSVNADAGGLYNVAIGDYTMGQCTGAAQDNIAIGDALSMELQALW